MVPITVAYHWCTTTHQLQYIYTMFWICNFNLDIKMFILSNTHTRFQCSILHHLKFYSNLLLSKASFNYFLFINWSIAYRNIDCNTGCIRSSKGVRWFQSIIKGLYDLTKQTSLYAFPVAVLEMNYFINFSNIRIKDLFTCLAETHTSVWEHSGFTCVFFLKQKFSHSWRSFFSSMIVYLM